MSDVTLAAPAAVKEETPFRRFVSEFMASKIAVGGLVVFTIIALLAIFAPWIAPQNPYDLAQLDIMDGRLEPGAVGGGGMVHWLGTDDQGRDMLSAIMYGARVSLLVGFAAVIFSTLVGVTVGLLAGYLGGKVDALLMRIADIQLSFPSVLIALFLMSAFGTGVEKVLIALTSVGWVVYARTVRGSTLREKGREYVQAARVSGLPDAKIILRHILPNVLTPLIVIATIQVGTFVLIEASLSFLGVGVPITEPSLGLLIKNGFDVLFSGLWWISVFPGLFIMLIVFGINLLGDFLRDELNPRLK